MKTLLETHEAITERHDVTCNKPLRRLKNGMMQCPECMAVHHGKEGWHDVISAAEGLHIEVYEEGELVGMPSPWKETEHIEQVLSRYFIRDTYYKRVNVTYELVS